MLPRTNWVHMVRFLCMACRCRSLMADPDAALSRQRVLVRQTFPEAAYAMAEVTHGFGDFASTEKHQHDDQDQSPMHERGRTQRVSLMVTRQAKTFVSS